MQFQPNPPWAEIVQLVPAIVLAISFIVGGEVDLARAGPLFLAAALVSVPISGWVVARGHLLNPILLGTAIWLWVGAAAFQIPVPAAAALLGHSQATGLFVGAGVVGAFATFTPTGYLGVRHPDHAWVRRASLLLLAATVVTVFWAWTYRDNVRIGGGLPFIALNVTRRILIAKAPP